MEIFIKHLTGRINVLQVKNTTTIMEVKKMIEEKDGIPVLRQRLIYENTHLLDDNKTLADYGCVYNQSTIQLFLKL